MKHLIHTLLVSVSDGSLIKYEIYTKTSSLGHYNKVPEGTSRIVSLRLNPGDTEFKVVERDLNIQRLFDANQPQPNAWYSDGQDRVSLEMIIEYLKNI